MEKNIEKSIKKIQLSNYWIAGVAAMGATVFTNPFEVIKTRLQLQGELARRGTYVESYRGVLHAFYQVGKHDGMRGLQKGLMPAFGFQFVLNALRLGIFDSAENFGLTKLENGEQSVLLCYFWGGFGGSVGSCAGSPFFLVKTHLQSYTTASEIAVGYQRRHEGMLSAFEKIYKKRGIRGLYRGVIGNIPRAALGSGAQLATFGPTKEFLAKNNLNLESSTANSFLCGAIAGSTMAIAITPPDIILTRVYNQPLDEKGRGKYYSGALDCFWKVLKAEGFRGLYKGFWPNYLRIAPHSCLVLLFYDEAKDFRDKYVFIRDNNI